MILNLDNVSKTYRQAGKRVDALTEVSLELASGELVGILGPGGAGKTTLLRIAAGLERPNSGSVTYKGQSLAEMSKAEAEIYRRREVGCIWGSRYLHPGLSVLDNVALPLLAGGRSRRGAEQGARESLKTVAADHCASARPVELSEGERQRAVIAQALVTKPRLLLADEPVSNLDFFEQDSLLAVFDSLARGEGKMAVLVADTNATALMRASPILYLSDGKLLTERSKQKMGELVELSKAALKKTRSSDA